MMGLTHDEWQALSLSLEVSAAAVLVSLPFGVAVAHVLARRQFPGKALVETLVNLPLVLPPVVTGYMLLVLFGRQGVLGSRLEAWFGLHFVFDWKGAALAAAVVSFPLMVRAMRVAFTAVDRKLEGAARSLGAGPWDCFFSITLPLARHGLIAGAVLAFARSLGEFGATMMVAGSIPGQTRTIPLYIFDLYNNSAGGPAQAERIVFVSILLSLVALAGSEWLLRREQRLTGTQPA